MPRPIAALRRIVTRPRSRAALLRVFGEYVSAERIRAIDTRLALPRRGGFRAPRRILMILFASRAGSGYAGRLLAKTPYFREVGESFRPQQLNAIRARQGLADNHATAQWMIAHRGTPRAFAIKGGFTQLIAATQLGFLPETIERMQFIVLKRRDRLAQAVSLLKAQASGRFHSVQPEGRLVSLDDYDADRIAFNMSHIGRNYRWFETLLDRLGKDAPVFYYEDMCAAPDRFVEGVCGLLALPPAPDFDASVDLAVLRDGISAAWVERYRAERG